MEMKKSDRAISVLIIDDEIAFCNHIKSTLGDNIDNILVELVHESARAINRIKEKKYDLLITDLKMPGVNGKKLIQSIAEIPEEKHHYNILLLSELLTIDNAHQSIKKVNYMSKPVKTDDLLNYLKRVIDNLSNPKTPSLVKEIEDGLLVELEKHIKDIF
ncbi:MAG: response regulator [Oligoflexia bacterium]|nr:response regulator [Oligoflexia bacterium]